MKKREAMSDKIRHLATKLNISKDGFTLVEVIVAVAIFSIVAAGIYSALSSSVTSSVNQDERATAKNLAEAQLEYVKQLKLSLCWWDRFDPDPPDSPSPPVGYPPDEEILSQYSGYTVTIDASTYDEENRNVFEQLITVTVFLEGEQVLTLEGMKLVTDETFVYEGGYGCS